MYTYCKNDHSINKLNKIQNPDSLMSFSNTQQTRQYGNNTKTIAFILRPKNLFFITQSTSVQLLARHAH